jgi:histone H3/H4
MNILTSKTIDKGNAPKDITIIRKMFDSLGIEEYEKNTLNYMSEFINSYIIDILKESKKNMILSNREKINIEDVELAVKTKQNLMYQNHPPISRMKELAEKVNSIPLPLIPETPNVLMPPLENNLLRNNFQIYSDELNRALLDEENKNIMESTSLRPDDINMLGNKRKFNIGNDSKNNLNSDNKFGSFQKKRRKISLNQAFKKTSQENAKKENMINNIENNNNNKININDNKKNININSINNEDNNDDIDFDNDNDNDEIENNNNVDSTNNNKDEEDEDLKIEDDENGDDDVEGEEIEGDNENDNESNNEGNENENYSEKDDEKMNDKKNNGDNKLKFIHDDDDEEDDYEDGY